jgi:hypothetical protein
VIATPYASGFDYFFIADEVQFKFDRCLRFLQETVSCLFIYNLENNISFRSVVSWRGYKCLG